MLEMKISEWRLTVLFEGKGENFNVRVAKVRPERAKVFCESLAHAHMYVCLL